MGFELLCLWGMVGLSLGAVVQAGRLLGRRLGAAAAVLATVLLGRLAWAFAVKDWSFAYVADNTRSGVGPLLRVAGLWAGPQGSLLLWTVLLAGAAALHAARRPAAVTGHGRAATGLWVLPAVAAVWATTLTRIGVIESVHAFADRPALRLALLVVAGAVSLVALVAVAQTRPVVALPVSGAGPWPPGAAVGAWWCWQPPTLFVAIGTYEP